MNTRIQSEREVIAGPVGGIEVLTELPDGAPRAIAIVNGTAAAALGLGLRQWIAGIALWAIGHTLAVFAAKRDPDFAPVLARHLRQRGHFSC